ncbi:MAG: PPC domain-containing protein [Acidobacteria bacterium]|nr:PPC domain-containing protein [Acidobacteriota bacterium]
MRALTLLYTVFALAAQAQTLRTARPLRFLNPEVERIQKDRRLQLPSRRVALRPLVEHRLNPLPAAEIAMNKAKAPEGVSFAGLHRKIEPSFLQGSRLDDVGGRSIWRAGLQSAGAAGLRVHFTQFDIGSGQLWVHDGTGDEAEIHGPYTGKGPFGDGDFWSDIVLNESLVIEYEPASPMDSAALPPFTVTELSHLTGDGIPRFADTKQAELRGAAASCNLDVTCSPEWAETAKAVGHLVFETGGSSFVCSGTLVNTRTDTKVPWFLTAQHCIDNDTVARTVNTFWFYQTSTCNGTPPNRRDVPRTLGSRYITGTPVSSGDATLLRLAAAPPSGVNFSGWDPNPVAAGLNVTGIHHPAGDFKRISFGVSQNAVRFTGKDLATFVGALWNGGGLTEGGSSGSGLFTSSLTLVGMLSHGPKADSPAQYCAMLPFADNYGRFSNFYPLVSDIFEGRSEAPNTPTAPPAAPLGGPLTSGQGRAITVGPVAEATLFNGENSFTVSVPQGATRLEITLRSASSADIDLYVRRGQDVALASGRVTADFRSENNDANETVTITGTQLTAGTYFIALGIFTRDVTVQATLTATVTTGGGSGNPGGTGQALTSGQPRTFTIAPVTSPTLFRGDNSFTITVPQGATRLEVALRSTTNADVDLYVRRGQDVVLEGGRVTADFRSENNDANETVTISGAQLTPGTYFIAYGVFSTNTSIPVVLTATVTGGSTTPPPAGNTLVSGQARTFSIGPVNSATLFRGENSFTINVPENATRLEIKLATTPATADVDLFARAGQDTAIESGRVVADARSEGPDGNETIVITGTALKPGPYFISYALFTTGVTAQCTLTATVSTGTAPATGPVTLTSGVPAGFRIGPVSNATLFTGNRGFRIEVPQGASRLDIRLVTATPVDADVDVFARAGSDVSISEGRPVFDHSSEGPLGSETISILPTSTPALQAGTYFIALALFTRDVEATGTITATVAMPANTTEPNAVTVLSSGVGVKFALPAVDSPTLFSGNRSFRIDVPQGASRLTVQLKSDVPTADTDLFVRLGSNTEVDGDGNVVAEYASTSRQSDETVVVDLRSSPPLRAGQYFISVAQFTRGIAVTGTVTATVEFATATESEADRKFEEPFTGEGDMLREKAQPGADGLEKRLKQKQDQVLEPKKRIRGVVRE